MPVSSAEVIPHKRARPIPGGRTAAHLTRVPTLSEVPVPERNPRKGEVVVYSGVSFGARQNTNGYADQTSTGPAPRGPIENLHFFTDSASPGQLFARVMIMEPGSSIAREAIITPPVAVASPDRRELSQQRALTDLIERANVQISRFFEEFGPIDTDLKLKEFKEFAQDQEDLGYLLSNLIQRNRNAETDLFAAYFAPGGAMSGVGVFVNTWL